MAEQKRNRNQRDTNHPQVVKTLNAGKWKTLEATMEYKSDLTNAFLTQNHRRIIQMFERLAMILRLAKEDVVAYRKIMDWHNNVNLAIANEQLETIEEQLVHSAPKGNSGVSINIPDSYKITFEVSHPITNGILNTIKSIDAQAANAEQAFFENKIDDPQLESARRQAMKVMNGILDRIGKVTSPGKREGGNFSTSHYVKLLKEPNFDLLELTDMPLEIRKSLGLIEEDKQPEESVAKKEKAPSKPKSSSTKSKAKTSTKAEAEGA